MIVEKKRKSSSIYSRVNNLSMSMIYDVLFKGSLNTYRPINSRILDSDKENQQSLKKGAIFLVQKKQHFRPDGIKGTIVTSLEAVEDNKSSTHFTPNVYRKYSYINKNELKNRSRLIKGFQDKNLRQINTFVIDIDTKKHSLEEILLYSQDNFLREPTMIISTDRGYHLYFVLEKAWFISNENEYLTLNIAKVIAKNIKMCFKNLDADQFCNDFGFFRKPKEDNIVYFDFENTFTMDALIDWSMRFSDDYNQGFLLKNYKRNIFSPSNLNDQEWFHRFISIRDIKGEKGVIGRNNHLFTVSLLLYSHGWSKERAFNLLDEINSNYSKPLKNKEVESLLRSAYSGKYKGASKESIQNILDLYADTSGLSAEERKEKLTVKLGSGYWYKFKKDRKDRVRSHLKEWEQDIVLYLTDKFRIDSPFIWHTQKEICNVIGIPQSTLNQLIKSSDKIIKVVQGKGCKAETGWSTVELFIKYVQAKKANYTLLIKKMLEELFELFILEALENPAKRILKNIINQNLLNLDKDIYIYYQKTG